MLSSGNPFHNHQRTTFVAYKARVSVFITQSRKLLETIGTAPGHNTNLAHLSHLAFAREGLTKSLRAWYFFGSSREQR